MTHAVLRMSRGYDAWRMRPLSARSLSDRIRSAAAAGTLMMMCACVCDVIDARKRCALPAHQYPLSPFVCTFACRIRSRSMRARHHSCAPGQLLADAVSVRRGHTTLGQVGYTQQPHRKGITIGHLALSDSLTHSLTQSINFALSLDACLYSRTHKFTIENSVSTFAVSFRVSAEHYLPLDSRRFSFCL
jgi:hypothetical protein